MGAGESKEVLDFQNKKGSFKFLNQEINLFSSSGLVLFYLVVGGNYIAELLSCRLQHGFSDNIGLKHLLGFLTLLFFVVMGQPNYTAKYSMGRIILQSMILYSLFVMTTKSEKGCFLFSILCFIITYFLELAIRTQKDALSSYESSINEIKQQINNKKLLKLINNKEEDKTDVEKEIKKLNKQLKNKEKELSEYKEKLDNGKKITSLSKLKYTQMILTFVGISVTIIGFFSYMGAKKYEYGKNFRLSKFIFGQPSCSGKSPELPGKRGDILNGLRALISNESAPGNNPIKERLPKTGQIVNAIKTLANKAGIKKDIFNVDHVDNLKEGVGRVIAANRFKLQPTIEMKSPNDI